MSWRDVFDCKTGIHKDKDAAALVAIQCGYRFMAWNSDVFYLAWATGEAMPTGIKVAQLLRFHESS